ncbi:MAG: hypothetical protein V1701_10890 [Planctomycetota bacterium]
MKIYQIVLLVAVFLIMLPGASCPPRPPIVPVETPDKNLKIFRDSLGEEDYGTAYYCLSENTRSRYKYGDFSMMMKWTIFGVLIRSMMINWETKSIDYYNENGIQKAKVILQHWKYPEYSKTFIFVYEPASAETNALAWRVDFTLAGILEMPQEDEDRLFPPPKKETTEEK